MAEIVRFDSKLTNTEPTFSAAEFEFRDISISHLATGMGRFTLFNMLVDHQKNEDLDANEQVWAGIDATSLIKKRTLFSEFNSRADPVKLSAGFYATQLDHWKDIIGETKYSPFTYIHRGLTNTRTPYPAIVGFSKSMLTPKFSADDQNIVWRPNEDATVEAALSSIYYFPELFIEE